jgi:hypothetical protein
VAKTGLASGADRSPFGMYRPAYQPMASQLNRGVGHVLGAHAGTRARDVRPRGEDRDGGLRQALIAGGEQRGHGEPASGRVARDQDPGRG